MKRMKSRRLLALGLSLVLAFSLTVPALAAEDTNGYRHHSPDQ